MSVINKMLKDLDDRQQPPGEAEGQVIPNTYVAKENNSKVVIVSLVAVVVSLLALLAWLLLMTEEPKPAQSSAVTPPIAENKALDKPVVTVAKEKQTTLVKSKPQPDTTSNVPAEISVPVVNAQQVDKEKSSAQTEVEQTITQPRPPVNKVEPKQRKQTNTNIEQQIVNQADVGSAKPNQQQEQVTEPKSVSEKPAASLSIKKTSSVLSKEQRIKRIMDKAKGFYDKGYINEAIQQFNQVLKIDDGHIEARNFLAAAWYGRNKPQQAISIINDGLQRYPATALWRVTAAKIFFKQNKIDSAFSYLDVDIHGADREFYSMKGNLARQLGQFAQAESAYLNLTELEPKVGNWWLGLAIALDSQEKYELALPSYQTVLRLGGVSSQTTEFVRQRLAELQE